MGSLGGHLLPGSFFIIFAFWWGFVTAIRFIQSRKNPKNVYRSSATMPCLFLPCITLRRAPVESYLKAVLAFVALVIEGYTGYSISYLTLDELNQLNKQSHGDHGHKRGADATDQNKLYKHYNISYGNIQHITMYSAFIIGAIVEIMVHHGVQLPKRIEYAMGIIAFSVEAFLFAFHLHGKEPLDVHVHMFLVYAIIGCIIFVGLEAYNPKQVLFTYGRILFTMLQGTWFFQVGFMLYPPTDNPAFYWDLNKHTNIMLATVSYCWHVILIIVTLLIQFWFVKKLMNFSRYSPLNCMEEECLGDRREMKFLALNTSDSDDSSFEQTMSKQKKKDSKRNFAITDENV